MKTIAPLTPITYDKIPGKENIEDFIDFLKKKEVQNIKSCFLKLSSIQQAYITVSCCFGGRDIVNQFEKVINNRGSLAPEVKANLSKLINNFNYDEYLQPYQLFEINAEKFGAEYLFFHNFLTKNLQKSESQEIFNKFVKDKKYLHQVKIRTWKQKKKSYRKPKRENENDELQGVNDSTYLIFVENQDESWSVGMMFFPDLNRTSFYQQSQYRSSFRESKKRQQDQGKTFDNSNQLKQTSQNKKQQKRPESLLSRVCSCSMI